MVKLVAGLASLVLGVAACGGDDGDPFANADPRCAAICQIQEPSLDGAYDICSVASASSCIDQCETRIADVATVCASCLLEDAEFDTDETSTADSCMNGTCTMTGRTGDCMYPEGDQAARDNCARMVFPRREVSCDTTFRPVTECASVCS
ncbi:MAG TPA: hypothetical protein VHE35_06210 [Kofleriaceae bacterium]|nr:hypothetical protein [Kofleriaceae bacterium]